MTRVSSRNFPGFRPARPRLARLRRAIGRSSSNERNPRPPVIRPDLGWPRQCVSVLGRKTGAVRPSTPRLIAANLAIDRRSDYPLPTEAPVRRAIWAASRGLRGHSPHSGPAALAVDPVPELYLNKGLGPGYTFSSYSRRDVLGDWWAFRVPARDCVLHLSHPVLRPWRF